MDNWIVLDTVVSISDPTEEDFLNETPMRRAVEKWCKDRFQFNEWSIWRYNKRIIVSFKNKKQLTFFVVGFKYG